MTQQENQSPFAEKIKKFKIDLSRSIFRDTAACFRVSFDNGSDLPDRETMEVREFSGGPNVEYAFHVFQLVKGIHFRNELYAEIKRNYIAQKTRRLIVTVKESLHQIIQEEYLSLIAQGIYDKDIVVLADPHVCLNDMPATFPRRVVSTHSSLSGRRVYILVKKGEFFGELIANVKEVKATETSTIMDCPHRVSLNLTHSILISFK